MKPPLVDPASLENTGIASLMSLEDNFIDQIKLDDEQLSDKILERHFTIEQSLIKKSTLTNNKISKIELSDVMSRTVISRTRNFIKPLYTMCNLSTADS